MPCKRLPDPKKAIENLLWLSSGEPLYLEQMSSQGNANPKHKRYPANEAAAAVRFVGGNNNDTYQRNIYFVPNAEFLEGKRNKANLSAVRFLHVDLDCKDYPGEERQQEERIIDLLFEEDKRPKGVPHPTAIWFTGGGFQAVWRLKEPISLEDAEELNHALLSVLQGGLCTHDASRLLRVPWSMNWLNDKKRADGREPKLAHPLHPDSPELVEAMMQQEAFKLPNGASFDALHKRRHEAGNGERIDKALHAIEEASGDKLRDVFQDISFNSNKLGDAEQKNDILRHLLEDFSKPALDLRPSRVNQLDTIGGAYEYLISRFAATAGKKAGEFYTPAEVSDLMARLDAPPLSG